MENRRHGIAGAAEPFGQPVRRDDLLDRMFGEVGDLGGIVQYVAHDDVGVPALSKGGDEIRADKSGAAGNQDHGQMNPP